jgi:hypothetical protein
MASEKTEDAKIRQIKAIQLRVEGHTYRQIAETLETTEGAVVQLVRKALNQTHREMTDELRVLETTRLDEALKIAWDILKNPSTSPLVKLAAIDRVIKLQERRTKYFGLDSPSKHEHTHRTELDAEIERLMAQLGPSLEAETARQATTTNPTTTLGTNPSETQAATATT